MVSPLAFARRTPLRRLLEGKHAVWSELADMAIADTIGEPADAHALAIVDLSPLPRLGFKGRGTIAAMAKRGVLLEATPNRAFRQPGGGLCLVLAPGEVILLANLKGEGGALEEMERSWRIEDGERTYPLPRRDSHAWFAVSGPAAPDMLAKLCAIDLRAGKFPNLAIAQTSVAKMSAIITRADIGSALAFHILADSAAALYFCACLTDAARELEGAIVGRKALLELERK